MQREPPKTLLLKHRSICHLLCVNYRANCEHQIDAIIQNGTIGCSGYLVWSFCLQHFVVVVAKIACACQACNILIANKYHKISQQKLVFARPLKSRYVNVIDIPRKWPATACCAIKNCTFCCCCCCCMIERAELERVGRADPLRTLDTFVLYINIIYIWISVPRWTRTHHTGPQFCFGSRWTAIAISLELEIITFFHFCFFVCVIH